MDEVFGLFPIPFMRAPQTLPAALVEGLVQHFTSSAKLENSSSTKLAHTSMLQPTDSALLGQVAALVMPKLTEFGVFLFGERLPWALKEMWVNVLDPGGRQAMHNHANSFASGVIYLTPTHPASQTVFMKAPGGTDFSFRNEHRGSTANQFCAQKWIGPAPAPGDMVLFPSYLLHEVPANRGERRITLAFNAIVTQLDSWGYVVKFG